VVTVAKGLKHDMGVNYCSMITGTHFPDGGAERGWEVVYHLMRQPVRNPEPNTAHVLVASDLKGMDLPLEIEVVVPLPAGDEPTVPSVQSVWKGADWNEKETWDLVGIRFDGHENMHRVLNPHDSPEGFHPLQKQHQIRYHDFNEMYDDAQGFVRKPVDEGRVK
jgi:NADH-quinone oxidoreductase subunit C